MSEWKTIDSAPKDGSRVLLWSPSWSSANTGQWYGKYWSNEYDQGGWVNQPTHWSLIPNPPLVDVWRDIEFAPQDGTHILAFLPYGGGFVMQTHWDEDLWWCESGEVCPSHWMPLPPPPNEATHTLELDADV